jgi:hypothetical protein
MPTLGLLPLGKTGFLLIWLVFVSSTLVDIAALSEAFAT